CSRCASTRKPKWAGPAEPASPSIRKISSEPGPVCMASERGQAGRARVGDGVADVGQAADVDDQALEAQAKAGMRHGAVAAEVAVPAVLGRVQAELGHAPVEHVQALLALAAADDLADARSQHVHGGDGLAVVVQAHVEGLDLLG